MDFLITLVCLIIVPIPMSCIFIGVSNAIGKRMGITDDAAMPGVILGISVTSFSWGIAFVLLLNKVNETLFL